MQFAEAFFSLHDFIFPLKSYSDNLVKIFELAWVLCYHRRKGM